MENASPSTNVPRLNPLAALLTDAVSFAYAMVRCLQTLTDVIRLSPWLVLGLFGAATMTVGAFAARAIQALAAAASPET